MERPLSRALEGARAVVRRTAADERAALGILLLGVILRSFRRSAVWTGSDAAELPAMIDRHVCEPGATASALRDLALYKLGGVESVLLYLQMSVTHALRLRVHEFGWELAPFVIGSANVFLAFLVVRQLAGSAAGLFAAGLLAVCPLNVIQSRHLGAPWMYEQCCQLVLLYLVGRLAKGATPGSRAAFHLTLAVYFWTGNQMLGIFPVLAYALGAAVAERDPGGRPAEYLWRAFGGRWLVAPALSLGALLYVTFALHEGHLAHALFEKPHVPGLYLEKWFDDLGYDIGPGATWFALAALVLTAFSTPKLLSMARLPSVLFVCYAAPFWFTIPPGTTLTRGYVTYHVGALLLVVALTAGMEGMRRAARFALPSLVLLMLLVAAGQGTFRLYSEKYLSVRGFQGSFTENNGVKTAAGWVRSRPRTNGRVFSDAAGGTGLEPPNMTLYFARPHYSMYDAPHPARPYEKFREAADSMDYLVVLPDNRRRVTEYFGDAFAEALRITDGARGEVLLVYARAGTFADVETRDVADGDPAFDGRYSLLCGE